MKQCADVCVGIEWRLKPPQIHTARSILTKPARKSLFHFYLLFLIFFVVVVLFVGFKLFGRSMLLTVQFRQKQKSTLVPRVL